MDAVETPSQRVRLLALALWMGLVMIAYISPPTRPDVGEWVRMTMLGYWIGQEAWLVAVFWLVGLSPLAIAGVLAGDLRARPVPAWPFVLAGFGVGGFAVIPWLVLSGDGGRSGPSMPGMLRDVGGRRWGIGVGVLSGAALACGAWWGDPIGYLSLARSEGFAFIMSFDFAALWLATLVMVRRRSRTRGWLLALVPVLGPALWVALGRR